MKLSELVGKFNSNLPIMLETEGIQYELYLDSVKVKVPLRLYVEGTFCQTKEGESEAIVIETFGYWS